MRPQGSIQLLPGASDELGTSVRNDGLRHTMQAQDVRNIQFSVLLSPVKGVHRNVMSRLGKSVDDHPNGVKLAVAEGQAHNEIHTDVFPFLGRNILRDCSNPAGLNLDPSTCVALHNILSILTLHTGPPKLCRQIMIHLCVAQVDGLFGSVSFIKYLRAQLMVLWNPQTILEPKSAFLIHVKTIDFRVTFSQPSLNVCDSHIAALSYNDFPSKHRGEGHIVLSHVMSYSNARFFPGDADSR
jgi:hypothetical protein